VNRFEIVGSRGTVLLENSRMQFRRNVVDALEFCRTAKSGFSKPEFTLEEIPFANATAPHAALMQNFVNAILDGEPLLAPGAEGIHSLELANAMVWSSLLGETITLPMNGPAWEARLELLIAQSRLEKRVVTVEATDFASSFRK
jgi:predicted dehydrogenase